MSPEFDSNSQAILSLRHGHEVDVVWHEAVAPDCDGIAGAPLVHQIDVCLVVFIREKGLLPAVAALCDVVGETGCNSSRDSGHDGDIGEALLGCQEISKVSPEFLAFSRDK